MTDKRILPDRYRTLKSKALAVPMESAADAIPIWERARECLDASLPDQAAEAAEVTVRLADLHLKNLNRPVAKKLAVAGLAQTRQSDAASTFVIQARTTLAILAWHDGSPELALAQFQEAYKLARATEAPTDAEKGQRVQILNNIGLCQYELGRDTDAAQSWFQALGPAEEGGFAITIKQIKRRLALYCHRHGRFAQAEKLLREIPLQPTDNQETTLAWRNVSATVAESRGRFADAIEHLEAAVDMMPKRGPGRADYGANLSNLALLKIDTGDVDDAGAMADLLGRILRNSGPISARLGYRRLRAGLAVQRGHFRRAATYWAALIDIIDEDSGGNATERMEGVVQLAACYRALGDLDTAVALLVDALPSQEKLTETVTFPALRARLLLANCLLDGDRTREAEQQINVVLWPAVRHADFSTELDLYAALARVAEIRGNREAGILFGKLAAHLIATTLNRPRPPESASKNVVPRRKDTLAPLMGALAAEGRLGEVFVFARLAQLDVLALLAVRGSPAKGAVTDYPLSAAERPLVEDWADIRAEAEALFGTQTDWTVPVAERAAAKQALTTLEVRAQQTIAGIRAFSHGESRPARSRDADAEAPKVTVPNNTILLEIAAAGEQVLVAGRGAAGASDSPVHHVAAAPLRDVAEKVLAYRNAILRRQDQHRELGSWLYDTLLAPVVDGLPAARNLLINPSGLFAHVPYASLMQGKRYLVEDYAISLIAPTRGEPSAQDQMTRRRSGTIAAAVFGASEAANGLPLLRFVGQELDAIAKAIPDAALFRGPNASIRQLRDALAADPALVHFACHYQLEPASAAKSYLSLGNGQRLYVNDILKGACSFDGVDCVTFSGCDTAAMELDERGLNGLAHAAIASGARSVVGALWPVDDFHTACFMRDFYSRLSGRSPFAAPAHVLDSLIETQRAALAAIDAGDEIFGGMGGAGIGSPADRETDDALSNEPYHWAGFVHYRTTPV